MASKQEGTRRGALREAEAARRGVPCAGRISPEFELREVRSASPECPGVHPDGNQPGLPEDPSVGRRAAPLKMRPIAFDFVVRRERRKKRHASEQLDDLSECPGAAPAWGGNA